MGTELNKDCGLPQWIRHSQAKGAKLSSPPNPPSGHPHHIWYPPFFMHSTRVENPAPILAISTLRVISASPPCRLADNSGLRLLQQLLFCCFFISTLTTLLQFLVEAIGPLSCSLLQSSASQPDGSFSSSLDVLFLSSLISSNSKDFSQGHYSLIPFPFLCSCL